MAVSFPTPSLVYTVERSPPELIPPSEPTPYELKPLSDIDDQKGFRSRIAVILFFPNIPGKEGQDPVKTIRVAIAKTLVHYYPVAGRIREGPDGKLVVECTGEGIMFIEANAHVTLDQFRDADGVVHPPIPRVEELLYRVPGSSGVINCPLYLIQVTRLLCGGFVFSILLNHIMTDAAGCVHFVTAVGDMARGETAPLVPPVWGRELLNARNPPRVTRKHPAYDNLKASTAERSAHRHRMAHRSFFFGPKEISSLRKHMPPYLQNGSRFDLITACVWKCRTAARSPNLDEQVRVTFPVNARDKYNPPLPAGFHGNGFGLTVASTTAGKICQNSLWYAAGLVKKARVEVDEEYMRSLADFLVINDRSRFTVVGTYVVSDNTRIRYAGVDFGWGRAVYGGPVWGDPRSSFFASCKNNKGEEGVLVMVDLPEPTMEKFTKEIDEMINMPTNTNSVFIVSHL